MGYVDFVGWEVREGVCCCHCGGGLLVAVDGGGWRALEMCDWYDIYLSACIIIPYEGMVGRCGLAAGD